MSQTAAPGDSRSIKMPDRKKQAGSRSLAVAYAVMVLGGILIYLAIRQFGLGLSAPAAVASDSPLVGSQAPSPGQPSPLYHVLLALIVVIFCARAAGGLCRWIHQPPVIGEVVAGIVLGPSLLGKVAPGVMNAVFPQQVIAPLGVLAQIGVVLFMFLIGVELNASKLRERSGSALAIAHASIVFPFVLGSGLSLYLYPRLSTAAIPFTAFSLFLGVSMSVTAFPVLARILTDRGLQKSRIGELALTCAAFADATAWCLLAVVVGVANSQIEAAGYTTIFTLLYLAAMVWLVRPMIRKWAGRYETGKISEQNLMVGASVGLLLSCLITERIGIHALFGAFLLGALIRHDSRAAAALHQKLYDFVVVLLLPAFFAMTGLRTQIGFVDSTQWLTCGMIILIALVGKFGGSTIAARMSGQTWRDSAALGILMNTRGLMELIVLNVGLDLGVISPRLFAMLVIMALVTTFATAPILDRIIAGRPASSP